MKTARNPQRGARRISLILLMGMLPPASGCVTVAEFHLRAEIQQLEGRLEVSEHRIEKALREASAARAEAAEPAAAPPTAAPAAPAGGDAASGGRAAGAPVVEAGEVEAYRQAYDAWRAGNSPVCVDRFRNFLQTYPASAYADDAAYWLADCYFKQGDYKTAVLRFDDVVSRYPEGSKAPDALYRQGEALLRLGPGYGKAAGKAFERVLKEYPDSGRATEAKRQLDLLRSG
jgi:tol-pal system protein YbgF